MKHFYNLKLCLESLSGNWGEDEATTPRPRLHPAQETGRPFEEFGMVTRSGGWRSDLHQVQCRNVELRFWGRDLETGWSVRRYLYHHFGNGQGISSFLFSTNKTLFLYISHYVNVSWLSDTIMLITAETSQIPSFVNFNTNVVIL